MERKLTVPSAQKALELMVAMLAANMMDNELEVDNPNSENPNYIIKFGKFSRDIEGEDLVGCPCFVCDFKGMGPVGYLRGIVYVKAFGMHNSVLTKMHLIEEEPNFDFLEIEDGEDFVMHDEKGRYEDERYVYKDGVIVKAE